MHVFVSCPGFALSPSERAAVMDFVRRGLAFALMRHGATSADLRVELARGVRGGSPFVRCTVEGSVEGFGGLSVAATGSALHEAVEWAVHRLELHLVEALLARAAATPALERRAA